LIWVLNLYLNIVDRGPIFLSKQGGLRKCPKYLGGGRRAKMKKSYHSRSSKWYSSRLNLNRFSWDINLGLRENIFLALSCKKEQYSRVWLITLTRNWYHWKEHIILCLFRRKKWLESYMYIQSFVRFNIFQFLLSVPSSNLSHYRSIYSTRPVGK
jgi:hypothetical protein